jgi:hypothetical protein
MPIYAVQCSAVAPREGATGNSKSECAKVCAHAEYIATQERESGSVVPLSLFLSLSLSLPRTRSHPADNRRKQNDDLNPTARGLSRR